MVKTHRGLGRNGFVMLHDNYMTYGAKERAFESQNKMSSCEEFFSRLRKLAVTVDKESSELKGILEDSEISAYDENRACLLLRETLAEVKDFKVLAKKIHDKKVNKQLKINLKAFIKISQVYINLNCKHLDHQKSIICSLNEFVMKINAWLYRSTSDL